MLSHPANVALLLGCLGLFRPDLGKAMIVIQLEFGFEEFEFGFVEFFYVNINGIGD